MTMEQKKIEKPISGAEALMRSLEHEGVKTLFGYPGGTILNVYNELYNYTDRVRHILTSHEQGAAHAADGGTMKVMASLPGPVNTSAAVPVKFGG